MSRRDDYPTSEERPHDRRLDDRPTTPARKRNHLQLFDAWVSRQLMKVFVVAWLAGIARVSFAAIMRVLDPSGILELHEFRSTRRPDPRGSLDPIGSFHPRKQPYGGKTPKEGLRQYLADRDRAILNETRALRVPKAGLYFRTSQYAYVPAIGDNKFRLQHEFGKTLNMFLSNGKQLFAVDGEGWIIPSQGRRHWVNPPQLTLFRLYHSVRVHFAALVAVFSTLLIVTLWKQLYNKLPHFVNQQFPSIATWPHNPAAQAQVVGYLLVLDFVGVMLAQAIIAAVEDHDNKLGKREHAVHLVATSASGILLMLLMCAIIALLHYEHPWTAVNWGWLARQIGGTGAAA